MPLRFAVLGSWIIGHQTALCFWVISQLTADEHKSQCHVSLTPKLQNQNRTTS